ncbi:MAG TPA: gephyrin-like molybdotransferase Glp [Variovorax sp.]|nr:gephyrin-like molybdotransferase Glp [Variovorax sp.]
MSRLADIAAALPGHDPTGVHVDVALAFLDRLVAAPAALAARELPLRDALDRVLACDVVSNIDVPPHDNSAMDGYAFDGDVLADVNSIDGDTVRLRVAEGTALAGSVRESRADVGEAVRIMTGAMMPTGLDTVVPQELCRVAEGIVSFPRALLARGANRRRAGEDLRAGRPVLRSGDRLTPAALGLAASIGQATLPVLDHLRVAYFSTGDELLGPGDAPRAGAVYDSNRASIGALLERLGCEVVDLGPVPDDPAALEAALRRGAREADAIVTTGGVSGGDADHTRRVMRQLGDVAFWSLAIRPGRPMAVGLITDSVESGRHALLFGLPGNPVAAMVAFLVFVRPTLRKLMGCNDASRRPPPLLRARLASPLRKRAGRTEFPRGFVTAMPGDWPEVRLADHQGSGVLSSMACANALVVLGPAVETVAAGELVDVMPFDGVM